MKFTGALNAVRKGKKVTRDGKTNIFMVDNVFKRERGKKTTTAKFTQDEIESGEWSVVKDEVKKVTVKAVAKKKTVKKKKKAA